jgi:hypothetical protein
MDDHPMEGVIGICLEIDKVVGVAHYVVLFVVATRCEKQGARGKEQ